jgi:hypothetical protein
MPLARLAVSIFADIPFALVSHLVYISQSDGIVVQVRLPQRPSMSEGKSLQLGTHLLQAFVDGFQLLSEVDGVTSGLYFMRYIEAIFD